MDFDDLGDEIARRTRTSVTMARGVPASALNRLDSDVGSPTMAICSPSRMSRPRRASARSADVRSIRGSSEIASADGSTK